MKGVVRPPGVFLLQMHLRKNEDSEMPTINEPTTNIIILIE